LTPALPQGAETPQQRVAALYAECRDDVYAYLASLLGDRATAEDVTALAFERAFRRRRSFNPRRGSERAWLFGIARNAALDELRRRSRGARLHAEPPAPTETGTEDEAETALRHAAVQAALAMLSSRERELIALKFHAGLSNPDLARVLRVSESNAGTMLHRTITKLRKACDEQA
jgi:RNA polymerase sigma-70 factor (ECF subfamily)